MLLHTLLERAAYTLTVELRLTFCLYLQCWQSLKLAISFNSFVLLSIGYYFGTNFYTLLFSSHAWGKSHSLRQGPHTSSNKGQRLWTNYQKFRAARCLVLMPSWCYFWCHQACSPLFTFLPVFIFGLALLISLFWVRYLLERWASIILFFANTSFKYCTLQ